MSSKFISFMKNDINNSLYNSNIGLKFNLSCVDYENQGYNSEIGTQKSKITIKRCDDSKAYDEENYVDSNELFEYFV